MNLEELSSKWQNIINKEKVKPYFKELTQFVNHEYQTKTCYPKKEDIINALKISPFEEIKVVLLGQDPYHGPGQAHGLSFSVPENITTPPSLRNIITELKEDIGISLNSPNLTHWAEQGVLLLNATLTVEANKAGSHQKKGWETFTDEIIKTIANEKEDVVFILWGAYAQKKTTFIDSKKHHIIQSVHPSPLSSYRGFFGSKPFSKTNNYLKEKGLNEIKW